MNCDDFILFQFNTQFARNAYVYSKPKFNIAFVRVYFFTKTLLSDEIIEDKTFCLAVLLNYKIITSHCGGDSR